MLRKKHTPEQIITKATDGLGGHVDRQHGRWSSPPDRSHGQTFPR